jgi:plasmid maintenance system antidote protein VapI/deoxycytidine triphosphate deaminase
MAAQSRDRGRRRSGLKANEHLRAELERLGLNQVDVSKATGVTRQTVNNVVTGRQPISRAMAAKLGRLTGRGSDYWLQDLFDAPKPQSAPRAGILVGHQITRAIRDGVIDVAGFDEARVRAASLELTLGRVAAPRGNGGARGVRVARGHSVRVITGERLTLPIDHLARIGAPPHLARLGAIAAHQLHVDPGFSGKLEICIFNAGDRDFVLKVGDPVVSLELVSLAAPSSGSAGNRRRR